jgi:hypothetical protein
MRLTTKGLDEELRGDLEVKERGRIINISSCSTYQYRCADRLGESDEHAQLWADSIARHAYVITRLDVVHEVADGGIMNLFSPRTVKNFLGRKVHARHERTHPSPHMAESSVEGIERWVKVLRSPDDGSRSEAG